MKIKKNNVQVSVQLDKQINARYQRLYPYTLTRFIVNAVKLALQDKAFFSKVFFYDGE